MIEFLYHRRIHLRSNPFMHAIHLYYKAIAYGQDTLIASPHFSMTLCQFDSAYHWLCQQRNHFPYQSDIWTFRFHWQTNRNALFNMIIHGDYWFSPLKRIHKANGEIIHPWSSQDALVLKLLAALLSEQLKPSMLCTHIKGHGGLKQSVAKIQRHLADYTFVCKTDVKGYYKSIDQHLLLEQVHHHISNRLLKSYLWQVVHRTVESGGNYQELVHGISRGCPISPMLGALYLQELDDHFDQEDVFYLRYMDDIIILSKTRWQNRRAITWMNQCFNRLKVEQHPDKTLIGRIERGFDFLGYHFSRGSLSLAPSTVKRHVERIHRRPAWTQEVPPAAGASSGLYEQQEKKKATSEEMALVLGCYVTRWQRWSRAGLNM